MKFALLLLFISTQACASSLPRGIDRAISQAGIPPAHVGIYVRDVARSTPLIAWHADQAMSPASTMKLVTSYAALSLLGPAYTWKTEALVSGAIENGVLDGPLILKGYGDPKLDIERLRLFVNDLRARGLRQIRGGLIFERSYFHVANADPAAFDNKPYRPYNVIPDALLVNFEANTLKFIPGEKSVQVIVAPDFDSLSVTNSLHPSPGPCGDWEDGISTRIVSDGRHAQIDLSGNFPIACGEKEDSFALYDHSEYLFQLFARLWRASGGKIDGAWSDAPPVQARLLAATESPPLSALITDMNKFSNNVMARQIFLTIGAQNSQPGTVAASQGAVKSWLQDHGLPFPELVMENGSGLSRTARISPAHMGELLVSAYRSPLMPAFFASLPIAGVDGTMKRRLTGTDVDGRAWIKTGSLEDTRAIAGIVQTQSGKRFVVVCFANDPEAARAKSIQDALLEWLEKR